MNISIALVSLSLSLQCRSSCFRVDDAMMLLFRCFSSINAWTNAGRNQITGPDKQERHCGVPEDPLDGGGFRFVRCFPIKSRKFLADFCVLVLSQPLFRRVPYKIYMLLLIGMGGDFCDEMIRRHKKLMDFD